MKQSLAFPSFFLPLLLLILVGSSAIAGDAPSPVHKLRIFFSGNVLAELGPCG